MGRLRKRINSAADSYYVAGEGYRLARGRMHRNRFNVKMNVLTLFFGGVFLLGAYELKNQTLLYLGLGIFALGCLTTWLTYRNRKYE